MKFWTKLFTRKPKAPKVFEMESVGADTAMWWGLREARRMGDQR